MEVLKALGIAVGVLGFLLSLFLAWAEIQRRFRKLRLIVNTSELFAFGNETAYVRLYLSLINDATIPRTIYRLRFVEVDGIHVDRAIGSANLVEKTVAFSPDAESVRPFHLLLDDVATWPLDVEPHHSRSFYEVLTVAPIPLAPADRPDLKDQEILIPVYAENDQGELMAQTVWRILAYR